MRTNPRQRRATWSVAFFVALSLSCALRRASAAESPPPRPPPAAIIVTPADRVVLQRGFVPVDGALRLYACVVGTPAGVHYAYDLESGALLSVWRGDFVDMVEIWGPRARNQTAQPAATVVPVMAKPLIAQFPDRMMIEFPKTWPGEPAPLYSYNGYELEANGQPTFLARFEELVMRDRIAANERHRGLIRRLEFAGRLPEWQTWVLIAEAPAIQAGADELSWTAGEGQWTVRWPADAPHRPVIRAGHHGQHLALRLEKSHLDRPVIHTIDW